MRRRHITVTYVVGSVRVDEATKKTKKPKHAWGVGGGSRAKLTVARVILDQPSAVTVRVAPVVGLKKQAAEAAGAVLPEPTGPELAVLARGRGHVVGGTLAAVAGV